MKFHWVWLTVGIVSLAAFAAGSPRYGKWILGIIVLGALVLASNRLSRDVGV